MKRPTKVVAFAVLCVAIFAFTACSTTRVVRMRPGIINSTEKKTTESAATTTVETAPIAVPEKEILSTVPIPESLSTPPAPPTPPQATVDSEAMSRIEKLEKAIGNQAKRQDGIEKKVIRHTTQIAELEGEVSSIKAALWSDGKVAFRVGFFLEGKSDVSNRIKRSVGTVFNDIILISKYLPEDESLVIDFIGSTSPSGSKDANQRISEKRAKNVADYSDLLIKTNKINARIGTKQSFGAVGISQKEDDDKCVFLIVHRKKK